MKTDNVLQTFRHAACACQAEDMPYIPFAEGVSVSTNDILGEVYAGAATFVGGEVLRRLFPNQTDTNRALIVGGGEALLGVGLRAFFPESEVIEQIGSGMTAIGVRDLIDAGIGETVRGLNLNLGSSASTSANVTTSNNTCNDGIF